MQAQEPDNQQMLKAAQEVVAARVAPYANRAMANLKRVCDLVNLATELSRASGSGAHALSQDVLRAGTVLLHAALEDFLRTVANALLPFATPEVLDEVPVYSPDGQSRGGKITLGRLSAFRDKTVNHVLTVSVQQYLDQWSCSSESHIVALLKRMGLGSEGLADSLPQMAELIKRRHSIVHRSDMGKATVGGEAKLQTISTDDLLKWLNGYIDFFNSIVARCLAPIAHHELVRAGLLERHGEKYRLVMPRQPIVRDQAVDPPGNHAGG